PTYEPTSAVTSLSRRGAQRVPEVKDHADADSGVGHVERRVNVAAEMEVDEVDHVLVHEPIDEIADDSAAQQAEAHLGHGLFQAERVTPEENRDQRSAGQQRERDAAP